MVETTSLFRREGSHSSVTILSNIYMYVILTRVAERHIDFYSLLAAEPL
jgi:hypothetical protein